MYAALSVCSYFSECCELHPSHRSNRSWWPQGRSSDLLHGGRYDISPYDCQCHEVVGLRCARLDAVAEESQVRLLKHHQCSVFARFWLILCNSSINTRKKLLKAPPQRHRINTVSGYDLQNANRVRQMKAKRSRPAPEEAKPSHEQQPSAPKKVSSTEDNKPKKKRNKHKKSE